MDGSRNPEIQRVLAALNSLSQQQQHPSSTQSTPYTYGNEASYASNTANGTAPSIPGIGLLSHTNTYDRPITPPVINRQRLGTSTQFEYQEEVAQQAHAPTLRSKTSTPKYDVPDASNITTWPAALKHVTRHLVSNEKIANRIKHLINEQHKHEREWWHAREAIVARHEGRSGNSQQVAAILKSLGAEIKPTTSQPPVKSTPEQRAADEAELKAYDEKVYKALCAMVADFDRQFREMSIPFYAIKHELVILKDGPEKTPGEHRGKLDKGELRELQKRMCQTLEDLFGDGDGEEG